MASKATMILQIGMKSNSRFPGKEFFRFRSFHLRAAFTMIELLLVVLILSVIAALAVPNFSHSYAKIQLRNNVYDIANLMRYAQSRAVIRNKTMRLQIDLTTKKYWIEEQVEDGFQSFSGRMGGKYSVISGASIEQEHDHILFYPDGRIEKVYITVCRQENCYTISTKEQRGFVHVLQGKM